MSNIRLSFKTLLLTVITIVFFTIMAFLSIAARGIREAELPHVTVGRLTRERFTAVEDTGISGGFVTYRRIALPVGLYEETGGDMFIIYQRMVNGEERDFVRRVMLVTGQISNGFIEIIGGVTDFDFVVQSSDRELNDHDEVVILR